MTTTTFDREHTTTPSARPVRTWATTIALGAAASATASLIVLAIGRAAGASFTYIDGGTASAVTAGGVLFMASVPLVVGTVLAAALTARWDWMVRLAQAVAGLAAIVTVPFTLDTDGGTIAALGAMHVIVGLAAVLVLEVGHRRTT
ncbi:DUF6069 family protein [Nitriliruptor alkaliphilus]|uniref:DUF6069 family protein n=1 Tax=Nitriliruptor alkaliphilus TaxID=427918 RepID=UPI0006969FC0|nr:DUF6069 family protein [Nitriliruptor alkaliphilus]